MASSSRARAGMTLEEFLAWPRIDRKPYLEYFDGRIEVKVSPSSQHGWLEYRVTDALNDFALPRRLGVAFPELRCTFEGRSFIPDVAFVLDENIRVDEHGEFVAEFFRRPDIHVEVRSVGQSIKKNRVKIEHSLKNGCLLGWFLDFQRKTADVYRPGQPPERLPTDGVLDGSPVLPGFRLPIAELFASLIYRKPDEGEEQP